MGFPKAGGLGGGAVPPSCKHVMIRATFPCCTHGDDMMFVFFYCKHGWGFQSGGVGGGAAPPFANTRIRATFPNRKHCDDTMLVFYCTRGGLKKRGGWGGRSPPSCAHVMSRATFSDFEAFSGSDFEPRGTT